MKIIFKSMVIFLVLANLAVAAGQESPAEGGDGSDWQGSSAPLLSRSSFVPDDTTESLVTDKRPQTQGFLYKS